MDFSFNQTLTKDLLLSKYSQETYLEYYLGIPVKKGLFKSPLRVDNSPTCSFYKNKSGDIIFKDFNGSFSGNFINVVMYKYDCTYYKALKIIAIDFGIIKGKSITSSSIKNFKVSKTKFKDSGPSKIQITKQEFTEKELEWWNKYNITLDILNKYNVYSCKNVFLNDCYHATSSDDIFIFGYYGYKKNKLELWRIYFPQRETYRFITNWPANKIQGFEQLPKSGKILVITKSMKDVMCLYSFNIPAIAPNSETIFVSDSILKSLKNRFKYIVVLWDNDLPGISNMNKIKKLHPELIYCWLPRDKAKDFSDLTAKYGKNQTLKFLKTWIGILSKKFKK